MNVFLFVKTITWPTVRTFISICVYAYIDTNESISFAQHFIISKDLRCVRIYLMCISNVYNILSMCVQPYVHKYVCNISIWPSCPVISWLSHQPSYVLFGKWALEALFFLSLFPFAVMVATLRRDLQVCPLHSCQAPVVYTYTHTHTHRGAELHKPCNFIDNMCTLLISICCYLQYD